MSASDLAAGRLLTEYDPGAFYDEPIDHYPGELCQILRARTPGGS